MAASAAAVMAAPCPTRRARAATRGMCGAEAGHRVPAPRIAEQPVGDVAGQQAGRPRRRDGGAAPHRRTWSRTRSRRLRSPASRWSRHRPRVSARPPASPGVAGCARMRLAPVPREDPPAESSCDMAAAAAMVGGPSGSRAQHRRVRLAPGSLSPPGPVAAKERRNWWPVPDVTALSGTTAPPASMRNHRGYLGSNTGATGIEVPGSRPSGDQAGTSRNWRYRAGRAAPPDLPVNISQRENKRRRGRLFFTSGEKFTR